MEARTKDIEIVDVELVAIANGNVPPTNVGVSMDHCIDFLQEKNDDYIIQEKGTRETFTNVVDVIGVINVGFDVKRK
jgi:hypothetical protein